MNSQAIQRRALVLAFLLLVAGLAASAWQAGLRQAMDQLARRGTVDLELASDKLVTQLQRYGELAVLVADHPAFHTLALPSQRAAAANVLREVADKTSALNLSYADRSGRILVSAQPSVRANVSEKPEFIRALHGALGSDHRRALSTGRRGWFFAAPVFSEDGAVRGALLVAVDVEDLEETWRGSASPVFFADSSGSVFIANRSELVGWQRPAGAVGLVPGTGEPPSFEVTQIGGHEVWRMGWGPYIPERAIHLDRPLPVIGMNAELLVDIAPARRLAMTQAAAVAAICLAFGALLFLATERRRALALANAVLEGRVADRTRALSDANTRLRQEVAERQEAEAALKRAQADLVQAGKLGALGQMSAGISHELNQPLMAIGSFAENGAAFLERGQPEKAASNFDRISGLARRMGRIIRNLRAFARQESAPAVQVDIAEVLESALELVGTRLRQEGVILEYDPPAAPVWVRGGEVRLGQVFVNLISNAVDAMSGTDEKRIEIVILGGEAPAVTVRDTGPGIDMPDKVFEPFYTTKEVGEAEGMGLGLSISYGIVQSFGGEIRGANAEGGGAVFTVQLEPWPEAEAAA